MMNNNQDDIPKGLISVATSTCGNVCKKFPGGQGRAFYKGAIETHHCASFEALKGILNKLSRKQCIIMGGVKNHLNAGNKVDIGPEKGLRHHEFSRTKKNFVPSGFILIDYDHCDKFPCESASEVHKYMCEVLPDVFTNAGYLSIKSSSSRVLECGEPIKGVSWHLYYMVDAPKQTKWLADNYMLAAETLGLTYTKMSKDGKQLLRTVIDLQPLKIGGCGIVYEANPVVIEPFSLIPHRINIVHGSLARTSALKPPDKKVGLARKKHQERFDNGYWRKSRALHTSQSYRELRPSDRDVLDDICMQYKGNDHGTVGNPIKCPYKDFMVHPSRVKKAIVILQNIGFIRYESGKKSRSPNLYYINFDMLFMKPPKGWEDWV